MGELIPCAVRFGSRPVRALGHERVQLAEPLVHAGVESKALVRVTAAIAAARWSKPERSRMDAARLRVRASMAAVADPVRRPGVGFPDS